jgi:hypothetical protein
MISLLRLSDVLRVLGECRQQVVRWVGRVSPCPG